MPDRERSYDRERDRDRDRDRDRRRQPEGGAPFDLGPSLSRERGSAQSGGRSSGNLPPMPPPPPDWTGPPQGYLTHPGYHPGYYMQGGYGYPPPSGYDRGRSRSRGRGRDGDDRDRRDERDRDDRDRRDDRDVRGRDDRDRRDERDDRGRDDRDRGREDRGGGDRGGDRDRGRDDRGRDDRDRGRDDRDRGRDDRGRRDDRGGGGDRDRRRRDQQIFGDQHLKHKINRGRAAPGCNIYVFRMPLDWDELELARHFDHYGDLISCTVVRDRDTGESRGFGFIGYSEPEAVRKAILGMDGLPVGPALELPGKFLSVSPKRGEEHLLTPFPDCYPPAGTYGTEPPNTRAPPGANLYIFNIPPEWRDIDLYRHFIHYGQLTSVKVMMKDENRESRGFGFVGFVNAISAQRAMSGMQNLCLNVDGSGRRLQVTPKRGEESAARKCRAEIAFKDPAHPDYQKEPPEEIEAGAAVAESLGVRSH